MKNSIFLEEQFDLKNFLSEKDMFSLNLSSKDNNCIFSISASTSFKEPSNKFKIIGFIFFNILLFALNLWGCYTIIKRITEDTNSSMRYSLFLVEFAVAQDFFLIIFNLMFSSILAIKNFFFFIFILYATLFSLWDNRVLVLIWRF